MTELEIKEESDKDPLLGKITACMYMCVCMYICIYVC
jgi:hypothetical protein